MPRIAVLHVCCSFECSWSQAAHLHQFRNCRYESLCWPDIFYTSFSKTVTESSWDLLTVSQNKHTQKNGCHKCSVTHACPAVHSPFQGMSTKSWSIQNTQKLSWAATFKQTNYFTLSPSCPVGEGLAVVLPSFHSPASPVRCRRTPLDKPFLFTVIFCIFNLQCINTI